MYIKPVLISLSTLFALSAGGPFNRIPCNCGFGSGEDMCNHPNNPNKPCTPLVVRPMEVPKPVLPAPKAVVAPVGGLPPLIPVGGPCSCHTSLVKPAVVPKPPCLACSGRIDLSNDQQLTLSQKQQILFGGAGGAGAAQNDLLLASAAARPILVDDAAVNPIVNPASYVPADPVSISIAQKLAQEACYNGEDKLSFGFRSLPKEMPLYVTRKGNNIPEGDLFNLNGQIVELKKVKCKSAKTVDEEAAEQLMALADEEALAEEDAIAADRFKTITLGEIGYGPAKIKKPTFLTLPGGGPAVLDEVEGIKNCDDGFKPGNVIIAQVPKPNTFVLPPPLPEPCPPEDEYLIPPPPAIPKDAVFTSPYTYLSSSSSSSSAINNKYSQSVLLQKIGCN